MTAHHRQARGPRERSHNLLIGSLVVAVAAIAAVLSMIGAIVGEYFGGPTTALGVTILNASAYTNFPVAWAGIVLASAFGILFYGAVAAAERLATPWDPSRRDFHTE